MTALRLFGAALAGAAAVLVAGWQLGWLAPSRAVQAPHSVMATPSAAMVWTCVTGDRRYTTITTACAWVAIPPTPSSTP